MRLRGATALQGLPSGSRWSPPGQMLVARPARSDVLTPAPGNPEALQPRVLPETRIGDLVVIGGAGAYCSGMAAGNYNSFPLAAEVMISRDGTVELIRRRQTLEQVVQNELTPSFLGR